jgi:serine/threonine-protein kinase RsbW
MKSEGLTRSTKTYRMSMRSSPKLIHRVEKFLQKVNEDAHLADEQFHKLLISATEAVNNSIFHGNKSDPNKKVYLTCELSDEKVTLKVRDSGEGFDPEDLRNPLNESNLLREGGRGIFLMRTLMDNVEYHFDKDGSEVVMMMMIVK